LNAERSGAGAGSARIAGRLFTTREIARLTRLSPWRVRRCVHAGILKPARGRGRRFEFALRDLMLLRAAKDLLSSGLGPRRIAVVLRRLEAQLPEGRDTSSVKFKIQEKDVVASDGRGTWSTATGQLLLGFDRRSSAAVRRLRDEGDDDDAAAYRAFARGTSIERRSPEDAKTAYREVLRLDPQAVPALVNLGRLEHESGNLAAAERLYRQALSLDPSERSAAFNLAVLAEEQGDSRAAIRRYEQALRVAPDLADAHLRLSRLHTSLGDRAAARRHTLRYRSLLRGH
jgi:tetratricopeptide (TPR) repeat protein